MRTRARVPVLLAAICAAAAPGPPSVAAQKQGLVHDRESGRAVAGAAVRWVAEGNVVSGRVSGSRGRAAVVTDTDGAFLVPASWGPGGAVEVRALGYRTRTVEWGEAVAAGWRIGLAPDPLALDEVVVTAGVGGRRRAELAIPFETIEAEEIAVTGAAAADRLLDQVPGLQVTGATPVGSNLMIRGIGGARVLVLIDGRPAAGALLENRDLSRLSLAGVERVEVVKGPLSSLYGSDALGGVVNLITRAPAEGFRVDAHAASGTAGRREAETTASGGGERLRYRVTGSWRQEDRVPGLDPETGNPLARVWDVRSRLHLDASERWDLRADVSWLHERQRWPVGGDFSGFNDNEGYSGWLEGRRRMGPGTWTGSVFVQEYEHLYRSARGDAPIAGDRDAAQRERIWRAGSTYSAGVGAHHLDVGVEGAHRAIRSPDKLIEERVADRQLAAFAQDAWRLGATVLSGGARLTWNSRWGTNIAPAVGLTHAVGTRLRVRASVARGFRAPSFKELAWQFVNLGGGYVLQGYPELEAERSWNASGGVEWSPHTGLHIEADVFANRIEDLIEPGFVGNTPSGLLIYSPRNVAEAVTQGFELRMRADFGSSRFSTGYAWLDARATPSDTPLDRRARHTAHARVSWIAGGSGLRVDVTGNLTGSAPIVSVGRGGGREEAGTQERLTAVDVRVAWGVGGGVEVTVAVDNLFDSRPGGWQSTIERRLRMGLALKELFGN